MQPPRAALRSGDAGSNPQQRRHQLAEDSKLCATLQWRRRLGSHVAVVRHGPSSMSVLDGEAEAEAEAPEGGAAGERPPAALLLRVDERWWCYYIGDRRMMASCGMFV